MQADIEQNVKRVFDLYDSYGSADYIGEPVSQIEHMSQAAALAQAEGYDDEVVLAAFFHDIGHLYDQTESMNGYGTVNHELVGGTFLKDMGFSDRLVKLVQSHVSAKRYLTFKYPDYYNQLSEASKATLEHQGGKMNTDEANAFEEDPDFQLMLRFRNWDDMAKEIEIAVNNIDELKAMATHHLEAQLH